MSKSSLLVVTLCVGAVVACGNGDGDKNGDTVAPATATCQELCDYTQSCTGNKSMEECLGGCACGEAYLGTTINGVYNSCVLALECGASDDDCQLAAFNADPNVAERDTCFATCKTSQKACGASDDICAFCRVIEAESIATVQACFETGLSCEESVDCAVPLYTPPAACGGAGRTVPPPALEPPTA
jgi:hypothetical protein